MSFPKEEKSKRKVLARVRLKLLQMPLGELQMVTHLTDFNINGVPYCVLNCDESGLQDFCFKKFRTLGAN